MTRRKIIRSSIPILLFFVGAYLVHKIWTTAQNKENQKVVTQYLPSINLLKLNGSIINVDSFKTSKDFLVLNYFDPECDHCQRMVEEMFREKILLQNTNWLMITSNTREKAFRFADSMNLSKLNNVIVLNDTASLFAKAFGAVSVPSFYVYKEGKLLRKHNGECSVAYLLQP